ncbi:hypothetical protein AAVH_34671, partial [Aphelenchoides avenae]
MAFSVLQCLNRCASISQSVEGRTCSHHPGLDCVRKCPQSAPGDYFARINSELIEKYCSPKTPEVERQTFITHLAAIKESSAIFRHISEPTCRGNESNPGQFCNLYLLCVNHVLTSLARNYTADAVRHNEAWLKVNIYLKSMEKYGSFAK